MVAVLFAPRPQVLEAIFGRRVGEGEAAQVGLGQRRPHGHAAVLGARGPNDAELVGQPRTIFRRVGIERLDRLGTRHADGERQGLLEVVCPVVRLQLTLARRGDGEVVGDALLLLVTQGFAYPFAVVKHLGLPPALGRQHSRQERQPSCRPASCQVVAPKPHASVDIPADNRQTGGNCQNAHTSYSKEILDAHRENAGGVRDPLRMAAAGTTGRPAERVPADHRARSPAGIPRPAHAAGHRSDQRRRGGPRLLPQAPQGRGAADHVHGHRAGARTGLRRVARVPAGNLYRRHGLPHPAMEQPLPARRSLRHPAGGRASHPDRPGLQVHLRCQRPRRHESD